MMEELEDFTVEDSRKWGFLSLLAGLPVYFLSQRFLSSNKSAIFALFVSLLIFTVRIYWVWKSKFWFWGSIIAISAMDVLFVYLYPPTFWPKYSMAILAPVAAAQLGLSIFIISTVKKVVKISPH